MAISVELPMFSSYRQVSGVVSLSHFASKDVLYNPLSCYRRFGKELNIISRPSRPIFMRVVRDSSSLNGYESGERKVRSGDLGADSEVVEVIGIGSRKDAIIDFCLDSLFQSVSLRFWNILTRDPLDVKLQQSVLGKDITPKIVESSQFMQSCSKAIILVASAGYGLDHIAAIDILKTIRCGNGFAFAIVLRPFSFEGRRRINEVNDLMEKLQQHVIFCIDVDTDMLLKKDLVTLDEALKTANNAVLLGINAISILISGMHRKFLDVMHNNVKELKVSEIMKILENCKEAKVGIGAGRNIETSILQAIYDCPFIGAGVKDLNGVVICVVASSGPIENNDMQAFLHTFRRSTQCKKEIVISIIHEPNMERNLLVATVVTVSCPQQEPSQKSSIFSRLAQHLPFVFNLLRRDHRQPNDKEGINVLKNAVPSIMTNSPLSAEVENGIAVGGYAEGFDNYSEEPGTVFNSHYDETYALSESEQSNNGSLENRMKSFDFLDQFTEGTLAFQREPTTSWNLGTGHETTQQWTERGAADSGDTPVLDTLSSFSLPVGVRPSEEFKDGVNEYTQHQEPTTEDDAKARPLVHSSKTESNFYDTASALLKGKKPDILKKEGNLSVRAASMLEAERDSPKKWSPVLEMQYRGGTYKGRCQGGLPEGKGRLVLVNGSIYDGMWHYGKRSGLGTFYFSNGDVFQGTWRDDVMHGKGWFYFHTGDRWFANFWKGKANGEGRFYSKCGDVFFGHFQDGWRHGRFLCIDVYGERYIEVWDKGILVTRELLDSDANAE